MKIETVKNRIAKKDIICKNGKIKTNYRLKDNEEIPTLKEVLALVKEQVPIVLELKVFRKNYVPLSQKVKEELKVIKDKRNIAGFIIFVIYLRE